MSKKIIICLNTSWNIYNFRLNLARSLKKSRYEVILVAPRDKYSEVLEKEFEYHDIDINNKGTNPKEDLKTLMGFYKLYKEIKPDLVLNYTIKPNIYGNIACSFFGIKTINNISGLGTVFIKESIVTKIVKLLYKLSLKKSSKVFFQNSDDKKLFVEHKLITEKQCDLLPGSGVDVKKFKPTKNTQDDNIFKFLLIARMLRDKGIEEYVEAARIIKNLELKMENYKVIEFQLLGHLGVDNHTAISKEQMDIWVKDGYVTYLGSSDDVRVQIIQADCVVLPSYREGTPRTLLESASMGKPLITTNTVGCKDVVDDGINGYLCKVKNAQDLADKMEIMLNLGEDERKAMGKAGREKMIKEFDEKIVIDKYLEAIKNIL